MLPVPTPRLPLLSILTAVELALSSIPVLVKLVSVPTEVIFGCAAVARVPVIFPAKYPSLNL